MMSHCWCQPWLGETFGAPTLPRPPCISIEATTSALLDNLGFTGKIELRGVPVPLQVDKRWVVERTQASMNGYGKLRCCTEKTRWAVDVCLACGRLCDHPLPHPAGTNSLPVTGPPNDSKA